MRILQINKFFYRRGGVEVVFFDTIEGLRKQGHEVIEFSMQHPNNLPSKYSPYFASEIPELLDKHNLSASWKTLKRLFSSKEIERKLTQLIVNYKPEVAHIHGAYHHLSASTFTTLFKHHIPVVVTLHDFFPLSPSRNFLIGEHLNEAAYKPTYKCITNKCINGRLLPSIAGTLEAYYYKWKKIWDKVDLFICPSQFMADKMIEWGYPKEKMRLVRNPFQVDVPELPLGNKIIYLGRVHAEKGVKLLLETAKELPEYEFVIAGTGPADKWVDAFIKQYNLTNIKRWGWVSKNELPKLMAEAKIIVVPSIFYENCPVTILEALSYQRVVVASNRGGNTELVIDAKTGFLCTPEDGNALKNLLQKLMESPDEILNKVAYEGKKLVEKNHNFKNYIVQIEDVYKEIA